MRTKPCSDSAAGSRTVNIDIVKKNVDSRISKLLTLPELFLHYSQIRKKKCQLWRKLFRSLSWVQSSIKRDRLQPELCNGILAKARLTSTVARTCGAGTASWIWRCAPVIEGGKETHWHSFVTMPHLLMRKSFVLRAWKLRLSPGRAALPQSSGWSRPLFW